MNKLDVLEKIMGKDFAQQFAQEIDTFPAGVHDDATDIYLASGNAVFLDSDIYYGGGVVTGSFHDPYRYPVLEQHEVEELWKCQNCGKVYRMKDTLECESCGSPITEDSRFVLER